MFLGKGVLEICSKFTGEYPCQTPISIKLQSIGVHLLDVSFPDLKGAFISSLKFSTPLKRFNGFSFLINSDNIPYFLRKQRDNLASEIYCVVLHFSLLK